MNETHEEPNAEKQRSQEEIEQYERYEQWMADHPEIIIKPEDLRECGPEVAELESMLAAFESSYPLAELFSITRLSTEEAPKHPVREPARLTLFSIIGKINILKKETNISAEKFEELWSRGKYLSRAVGTINENDKVLHDW